jgi:hypothetical protein
LITALGVFIGGSTALAAPSIDTLLTAGYDAEEMKLIYGISPVYDPDSPFEANNTNSYDCSLDGEYTYTADAADTDDSDGTRVGTLEDDEGPVEFSQEDEDAEGTDVLTDAAYGDPVAAECDLTAYDVRTTAEGEVNHGMVVSTFVQTLKDSGMKGIGCLVRHVAQSDWGKDDADDTVEGADLTVTLESLAAACSKGHGEVDGDDGPGNSANAGNGKPPWAGPDGDKSTKPGKGPGG